MNAFTTDYQAIVGKIETIEPVQYASTRNYLNGAVTYLSPYISRGVISTKQVLESLLARGFQRYELEKLVQELAWRDYFQRVWEALGDKLHQDIKQPQPSVHYTNTLPTALEKAETGIEGIDKAIQNLYETGYMHNHARMYMASLACNVGKAHWCLPSRWLYYHLLDADVASNTCSWQWVAGAFSSKKYYANQENINRYLRTKQTGTFLDTTYDALPTLPIPAVLEAQASPTLPVELPESEEFTLDTSKPTLLYNAYNLDVLWHAGEDVNRILLLEPSHFVQYPMSRKTIDFILALSRNIPNIRLWVGELSALQARFGLQNEQFIFKKHPAFEHYVGKAEERDFMFPELKGYFPSFFNYWNKCERYFKQLFA
jgi:deoxyribodipyrimidine photo-lyase